MGNKLMYALRPLASTLSTLIILKFFADLSNTMVQGGALRISDHQTRGHTVQVGRIESRSKKLMQTNLVFFFDLYYIVTQNMLLMLTNEGLFGELSSIESKCLKQIK